MENFRQNVLQVHQILDEYINIHDGMFKFSWRKILPIPGLFKPIEMGRHSQHLNSLAQRLERIYAHVNSAEKQDVFPRYVAALRETIIYLKRICEQLDVRAQGNFSAYKKHTYFSDVNVYQGLVSKYMLIGDELNLYLQKHPLS